MAKKKKAARRKTSKKASRRAGGRRKVSSGELIISKSRTKGAASMNVSGDFYGALDSAVRDLISRAEGRASANNRRTLRPQDL